MEYFTPIHLVPHNNVTHTLLNSLNNATQAKIKNATCKNWI